MSHPITTADRRAAAERTARRARRIAERRERRADWFGTGRHF